VIRRITFRANILLLATLLLSRFCLATCSDIKLRGDIDSAILWQYIITLASDRIQGRQTASPGAELARQYIGSRYRHITLRSFPADEPYLQPFSLSKGWSDIAGTNVVGWLEGRQYKDRFIVVTAHYDHLGKRGISTGPTTMHQGSLPC
jgi:hypothetical protein